MEQCGFLVELLEGVFDVVGKTVIDGIMHLCMWLVRLIVPEKTLSARAEKSLRRAVTVYTALLVVAFIIGVLLLAERAAGVFALCLTFIPLGLIGLQLVIGVAFRAFLAAKKKK